MFPYRFNTTPHSTDPLAPMKPSLPTPWPKIADIEAAYAVAPIPTDPEAVAWNTTLLWPQGWGSLMPSRGMSTIIEWGGGIGPRGDVYRPGDTLTMSERVLQTVRIPSFRWLAPVVGMPPRIWDRLCHAWSGSDVEFWDAIPERVAALQAMDALGGSV